MRTTKQLGDMWQFSVKEMQKQETKIDDTFSNKSIQIPSYEHKPFRRDRKFGGGEIITYVHEDIPASLHYMY